MKYSSSELIIVGDLIFQYSPLHLKSIKKRQVVNDRIEALLCQGLTPVLQSRYDPRCNPLHHTGNVLTLPTFQVVVCGFFFFPVCEKTAQERGKQPLFSGGKIVQGALIAVIIFAIPTNKIFSEDELKITPWICGSCFAMLAML